MNSEELDTLIELGELNPAEQEEFMSACEYLSPDDRGLLGDVFEDDPGTVRIMYDNYKAKRGALDMNSAEVWANLLKEEEYQLETIENEG
jgi:hypothetical protein